MNEGLGSWKLWLAPGSQKGNTVAVTFPGLVMSLACLSQTPGRSQAFVVIISRTVGFLPLIYISLSVTVGLCSKVVSCSCLVTSTHQPQHDVR